MTTICKISPLVGWWIGALSVPLHALLDARLESSGTTLRISQLARATAERVRLECDRSWILFLSERAGKIETDIAMGEIWLSRTVDIDAGRMGFVDVGEGLGRNESQAGAVQCQVPCWC